MFCEEFNWNWGDQSDLPTACDITGLFEGIDSIGPSQDFNFNLGDSSCDIWSEPRLHPPNLEQQLQLHVSEPATNYGMATTPDSVPTSSAVNSTDTVNPPVTNHGKPGEIVAASRFTSCRATGKTQEIAENERLRTAESGYLTPLSTFLVHRQARGEQTVSSQQSKHGQTEKHFCTYSDCSRSQLGSGFYRKDHLDQHLRGLHKQNSVPRLRAKSAAALSTCKPTATSETTGAIVQSKRRKRESEGELGCHGGDGLFEELTKERGLRLLAEQENQRLRQKMENYEGRMQKYEERLDRMMTFIEEHKGVGKGLIWACFSATYI